MRIGRYQLKGVRARFWVFLGLLALVIFLLIYFWPSPENPQQKWIDGQQTAFSNIGLSPTAKLQDSSLDIEDIFADERLGNCREGNPRCIYYFRDTEELLGFLNPNNAGYPFRFRAYIPSPDTFVEGATLPLEGERKSLYSENFTAGGWKFKPGVLLDTLNLSDALVFGSGLDTATLDSEAAGSLSLSDDNFLGAGNVMLGFQGGEPASGAIYDFDAMLFSSSNAIQKPTTPFYAQNPLPTLLVREFRRVGTEEVLEPASEVADLDIYYSAGERYGLSLHNFEWPSDGKARMCITLENRSPGPVPIWGGLYEGMRLRLGNLTLFGAPAPGSAFEIGTTIDEMQTGESLSGYIIFGAEQDGDVGSVANVSGSPSEQEVRLSIASLLGAEPGVSGSLSSQQVFIDISDGVGGGIPFQALRQGQNRIAPLSDNESCSE